jgi:hypothetical protein
VYPWGTNVVATPPGFPKEGWRYIKPSLSEIDLHALSKNRNTIQNTLNYVHEDASAENCKLDIYQGTLLLGPYDNSFAVG